VPDPAAIVAAVALAGWAYARGLSRLWSRAGSGRVVHGWQAGCFAAGLLALVAVLATPFEHLAEERLWAHMVQHLALEAVAAPLLVLGNPLSVLPWALPHRWRRTTLPWGRRLSRHHARPASWAAWALAALALQTVTLWAWHLPTPYQAALRTAWVHGLEHASFLATALVFWWAVIGARRRSLYGPGVLVTFGAALQGSLLGVLMALASRPWYPVYAEAHGPASGLTPLEDQQVAGVIMWGPGGMLYAVAAVLLFAAWIRRPERSTPSRPPAVRPVS
jgi:putative membrane protein